ncbi:MAG: HAMP domain-containing sensor histidine kinase [Halioglobus sp.]|nr:HAMP domain-containing sensor histidine kinase [Halioglobus sp.]
MSLRRQLTLSLVTILVLFAANVGTHFWGSYARNESMIAYRNSVSAAQLSTEVEQLLDDQRQQILILAALRDTTEEQLDNAELQRAESAIVIINQKIQKLGQLSRGVTEQNYELLWQSSSDLLKRWLKFYRSYNDPAFEMDISDPLPFLEASQRLSQLEQRQAFIAAQRSDIIDRTIDLTDRITVIGFFSSIFLTATLGYFLLSYTNTSLKSLKKGTERFGSGDLNYRIDNIDDTGELGDLADAFNDMSDKLGNAIYDVRKARDSADEANAAKSMFLANVSHELRTPLNAIIGYSEMLHDELGDKNEINRPQFQLDLGTIIQSGRQLLSLIDDILDLSKIETGKMSLHCEAFNPTDIIKQACEVLAPLLKNNNNELLISGLEELPELYNDAAKFRQIFTNLLSNANKFTQNGHISVTAQQVPDRPGWITFAVEDTGIGITGDQISYVFDAFAQAEPSTSANYGGTGLGLAISRDFCTLMGGTITVASEIGVGSTFTVLIPTDPELTRAAV